MKSALSLHNTSIQMVSDGEKYQFAMNNAGTLILPKALVTQCSIEFSQNYIDVTSWEDDYQHTIPAQKSVTITMTIQSTGEFEFSNEQIKLEKKLFKPIFDSTNQKLHRTISLPIKKKI